MKWRTLFVACCLTWSVAHAQPNGQNGKERPDDTKFYNPATVETVRGEVTSVEEMPPGKDMQRGIHLHVKTAKETLVIHLGPPRFLAQQDMQIREGDPIEVSGSRVIMNEKPAIIARTVKSRDKTLTLRNENGVPVWARVGKTQPEAQ